MTRRRSGFWEYEGAFGGHKLIGTPLTSDVDDAFVALCCGWGRKAAAALSLDIRISMVPPWHSDFKNASCSSSSASLPIVTALSYRDLYNGRNGIKDAVEFDAKWVCS